MQALTQRPEANVQLDSWLRIPKWMIRRLENVKGALTIPNGAYFAKQYHGRAAEGDNTPSHFFCYEETEQYLNIPRNALLRMQAAWFTEPLGHLARVALEVRPPYQAHAWMRHAITLRPHQQEAAQALQKTPGDKILSLACGFGKTTIALHGLMEMRAERLPALVVVHTKDLMEQWVLRIRQFWCMGLAMPGVVQGDTCTWKGAPITVAMLQTLAKRKMPEEFYQYFATVVYDELHRCGAPWFMSVVSQFSGQRWGLSATVTRPDGNEKAFMLHTGRVCYQNLTQELLPKVFFVRTRIQYDMDRFRLYGARGKINFAKLATTLSQDVDRNALVLQYINRMVKAKRVVLVLGERVEQLQTLAAKVPEAGPLIGPMNPAQRRAALKKQVVFATSKLAKEGLDRPEFDCLVVLNPTTDANWLQQAIGRVQRSHPDKQHPVVVFFEDTMIPPMANRGHKIRQWLLMQKMRYTLLQGETQ